MSRYSDFQRDYAYSMKFVPEFNRILGSLPASLFPRFNVRQASFKLDTQHATDFVVGNFGGQQLAARIRRPNYFEPHYRKQFTIRSHRDSGAETELAKIERGFADWIFYGFGVD